MTQIPDDYADRIRLLRARLGVSQRRLAELLGVSFVTVNRWENLQSRPTRLAWMQIRRAERLGLGAFHASSGGETYSSPPGHSLAAETGPGYGKGRAPAGVVDFGSDPAIVRSVVEAHRLTYGHLFNPGFIGETSLIDPLPHQRIAVYQYLLNQPRLRFLLADDAGAGKTIMAGMYVREMLARRLIRRVLIVAPAGLVGNWKSEMQRLFSMSFRVISGGDSGTGNPFAGSENDLAIISLDTLCAGRTFERLRGPDTEPYDLVVFDEAHKLAADRNPDFTVRKTDRYRLAEAVAGASTDPKWTMSWSCRHLLLMTATPHMGKDFPYFCLWRLLEPEGLPTPDAFNAYPIKARRRHFLRRTKEEMVRFDGSRIFPMRESNTVSYDLTEKEQELYDKTTEYIRTYYNRARILNRSAVRLAMSVFQRRLASSTRALLRSLERRQAKLDGLIRDIIAGVITIDNLLVRQRRLDDVPDVLEEMTAEEEDAQDGVEQNEACEDAALSGVVASNIAELQAEQVKVVELLRLAREVLATGVETKFESLRELVQEERFKGEKVLIFTEHRDTQDYLVESLEALGYGGRVARIHGGMDYRERDDQISFFRRDPEEGGASLMVATDAAGEGINLQFCWMMVNYDIPWNPARLEQRMGRVHRYKQMHDPVLLFNLVAASTREGQVLKTLLDKLERIRKELGSDKVFDIIGRQFQGASIKELIIQAVVDGAVDEAVQRIEGILTPEQVRAKAAQMEKALGSTEVAAEVPAEKDKMEREELLRLVPGYVRHFLQESLPLMGISMDGDPDGYFGLRPARPGALDPLLPFLEEYEPDRWDRLTLVRREEMDDAIFFRPGEPLFDGYSSLVTRRFASDALRGAAFVDPYAERPYLFHLMVVEVVRKAGLYAESPDDRDESLEARLVALRQEETGQITECPVEHLMFLRGGGTIPVQHVAMAAAAQAYCDQARGFALETIARPLAEAHMARLAEDVGEQVDFVARGYDYRSAELLRARGRLRDLALSGDKKALAEIATIKEKQRALGDLKEAALAALRGEPELIDAREPRFLAHAFVIPSTDPDDRRRHDAEVERVAVRISWEYEADRGSKVTDVSSPANAVLAGLEERPGFDLLSHHPDGEARAIEVKGRAGIGDIELTENEWVKACNYRSRYWLYVVYGCASPRPRLLRIQDPFLKLFAKNRGGVIIDEREVFLAAEKEEPYDQG